MNLDIRSRTGEHLKLDKQVVDAFASQIQGRLLFPDDPEYDEARSIWNGMIDKRPAMIARCSAKADVIDAVNFAKEHDLLISVLAGGHNIAGTAVCEGGLMIDLSQMTGIQVDADKRRVWAEPGNTLGDLDRETQEHGLVVPGGIVSTTGISGYTLGGGFGWLTRKWGYTSDSLRAVEIVLPDGELIIATKDNHPDLFWALAGGGGNFGVVTGFEYEAQPYGPEVMAGLVFHPMDEAAGVIDLFRQVTADAPDELTCLLVLRIAPPAPFIPVEFHGKPVAGIVVNYAGPVDEAEPFVRPIKEWGAPLLDSIQPKPFVVQQSFLDSGQPHGRSYYWKSDFLDAIPEDLGETMIRHCTTFSSPLSSMLFMHLGGAASRVPAGSSAVAHGDAEYVIAIQAAWEDLSENAQHIAWAREFFDAVRPYSSGGTYVNFLTEDEGEDRVRQAYDEPTYQRLAEVKLRYDPQNMFNQNKNIRPAREAVPAD